VVGSLTVAALAVLLFSRDQSHVAQVIEAVVALSGAASSLVGLLAPRLRRQGRHSAAESITGFSVAVPTGQLPRVVRGRDQLLERLHRLERSSARGPAVLTGVGGAGKSTIAAAFAETGQRVRFGRRRCYVWWVSAADLSSLTGGLVTVARQLGASEADLEVIRAGGPDGPDRLWALLDGCDRRWLLVLDNADDPSVLANPAAVASRDDPSAADRRALPADGTGWVRSARRGLAVVTTRDSDPAAWGRNAHILPVDPLDEAQAARVLLDCAPKAGSEAEAKLLARRLGGLPLPLQLAGSYLDSDAVLRRSFDDYAQTLDHPDGRPRLLSTKPGLGVVADSRSVVMRTWEMSLDELTRRGVPQARPLLRLLSCFAWATPIPRGLLTSPHLARLLGTGPQAPPLAGIQPEHGVEDGLHGLKALGLIDIRPFGGTRADERAIVVHPVVADTNRAHLANATDGTGDAALIRCIAIEIMVDALGGLDADRNADWPDYLALGPHLHALYGTVARHVDPGHLAALLDVTTMAARGHESYGDVPAGERLSRAACGAADLLGEDDPASLRARHELAWCVAELGRWAEAEATFRDVLAGFRRVLGDEHPDTLNPCHELAWVAAYQGRWAEAEASFRDVLAVRSRVLGPDHPETLITRHELGWAIANQDREQEAEPILREVLLARNRLLGERSPRTLMARQELAWVAARLGNLGEAEAAYRELIQSRREVLRDDHPDTLTARHELAWVMALAGRRRAALRQYRDVLSARMRVLGESHPATAATRDALASLRKGTIVTPRHNI
jgi:tetratricopeptide (TPR) repeat protein